MNSAIIKVFDDVRSCLRFRWIALGVASVTALIGWAIVFSLPDRFDAFARIFVDTRTALKPVLQGLTVGQDVDAQLNYVRQSLLAGTQLMEIAKVTGVLAPDVVDPIAQDVILNELAERVEITVRSAGDRETDREMAGSIYGIDYLDHDRDRALKVVQTLVNTLINETQGGKREGSQSAQKFLEEQIHATENRLRTAEDKLAEFKKHNIGLMPTEQGGYFSQLQAELDAVKKAEAGLSVTLSRRSELERQLHGEAAVAAAGGSSQMTPAGAASGGDTLSRIMETQARLDDLLLKFTDRYPDVVATRETLEQLKRRREAEMDRVRRGDANAVAASGAASNPVYQSMQLALNQTEVEIAALRGELSQHQAKAAELRKRLDTAPEVEAEFAQLNRDYDVNKAQYSALMANYAKARLGEQADNAGAVRFEIVQPPVVTFQPVWPRRLLLLTGVFAGASVLGAGVAFLLHLLFPVVGSSSGLTELTGLPVLGIVSAAFPEQLKAMSRRKTRVFLAAAGCLAVTFIGVVVLSALGGRLLINHEGIPLQLVMHRVST